MKNIKSLEINGKRWNAYLQAAAELLRENGYNVPTDNRNAYSIMCRYDHSVEDVKRKKDL